MAHGDCLPAVRYRCHERLPTSSSHRNVLPWQRDRPDHRRPHPWRARCRRRGRRGPARFRHQRHGRRSRHPAQGRGRARDCRHLPGRVGRAAAPAVRGFHRLSRAAPRSESTGIARSLDRAHRADRAGIDKPVRGVTPVRTKAGVRAPRDGIASDALRRSAGLPAGARSRSVSRVMSRVCAGAWPSPAARWV
jgi:hypothetical protein